MKKYCFVLFLMILFVPAFASKPTIYYFDVTYGSGLSVGSRVDQYHATACVQGIVNREAPRIFVKFWPFGENGGDYNWLVRLRQSGGLCEGWPVQTISGDVKNLITKFEDYINGVILFDTDQTGVISTMLAATTAAGCEDAIAVRKDTSAGSLYNWLVNDVSGPQFPVLIDLTGKFTGSGTIWDTSTPSTGSAKCDAYIWAKEKYLDTGRCDPTIMSYGRDLYYMAVPGKNDHAMMQCNLDYAVMKRAFCYELSPWTDEVASDDPSQPSGTDGNTMRSILASANARTGQQEMIKTIGFVGWETKYSTWAGGSHDPVGTEWEYTKVLTAYNSYMEATWQIANSSFHSGLLPLMNERNYVQNPAPTYQDLVNRGIINSSNGSIYDGHYIMLALGDYDGSTWVYYNMANGSVNQTNSLWGDSNRGQVYCSWGLNPNLMDTIGTAFDYFYRTKSSKDYFMSWDSGAGYVNPGQLWESRISGYSSIIPVWQEHCKDAYRLLDYSISGWLLDGSRYTKTTDCDYYACFSGDGIGLNASNFSTPVLRNNIPILKRKNNDFQESTDPGKPAQYASDIDDDWSGGVDFDWYRTILLSPSFINEMQTIYAGYGRNHRFLDPFSFYYLLRYKLSGYNQQSNWYRETFVSNTIPRIMSVGQTYSVTATLRNDGWDTWTSTGSYSLGHAIVSEGVTPASGDYDARGRIAIPGGTVASGSSKIFSFNVTAPSTPGTYDLYLDMVRDGVTWFVGQNNIPWKQTLIVAANETDIDTDGDGVPDVTEDAQGTYWWHPDDQSGTSPTNYDLISVSSVTGSAGVDGNWLLSNAANGVWWDFGDVHYPGVSWAVRNADSGTKYCQLNFTKTETVAQIRIQQLSMNIFSEAKDIRIDFSDGTTKYVTMDQSYASVKTINISPFVDASWVKVTILNHYGDSLYDPSISDYDTSGFAEVACYTPPDTEAPIGNIAIENGNTVTFDTSVNLQLSASDTGSGVSQMRLSNDGTSWSSWESFSVSKTWTLSSSFGNKTTYVQYKDVVGNVSSSYNDSIYYTMKGDFVATWQDVDISDLAYFAAKWLDICGQDHCQAADINLDGDVGLKDFAEMARNW